MAELGQVNHDDNNISTNVVTRSMSQKQNAAQTLEYNSMDDRLTHSRNTNDKDDGMNNTENEVKLFHMTPSCIANIDPATPFGSHRSALFCDLSSSTASSGNVFSYDASTGHENNRDQSITITEYGDLHEQRRQVNLLCNSFSDLAFNNDAKLCKSFDEIALDIDQITSMIITMPSPKSLEPKSVHTT